MTKYRKKPVVVEAEWFDGTMERATEIARWCGGDVGFTTKMSPPSIFIETKEGTMRADPEDFIIKGIQGEFYPCKPGIFVGSYEPVEISPPKHQSYPHYYSTYCMHELHDECRETCKHCSERCKCDCHKNN